MDEYQEKINETSKKTPESKRLVDILLQTYDDHKEICDILNDLPQEEDRVRLLKYIDKPYIKDKKKFIKTYILYRVKLERPKISSWLIASKPQNEEPILSWHTNIFKRIFNFTR